MGNQRITQAIEALQLAGFRADRGYPSIGMPYPSAPVVAVNLQEQTPELVTLAATVYCTVDFGGIVCEDQALQLAQALGEIGGECTVGDCSFSGKTGLFSVTVTAVWPRSQAFTVQVGTSMLPNVTAVSARQTKTLVYGEEAGVSVSDEGWQITVEEWLPFGSVPEEDSSDAFQVIISRPSGTECYEDCRWQSIEHAPVGNHVLRRRVARTWSPRTIALG